MRQDMTSPLPPEVADELVWLPFDEDESAVWKHIRSLTRDLAAARAEAEGARRDAERYRWLRDGDSRLAVCDEGTSYYLEQLDAAIDAALQEHTP